MLCAFCGVTPTILASTRTNICAPSVDANNAVRFPRYIKEIEVIQPNFPKVPIWKIEVNLVLPPVDLVRYDRRKVLRIDIGLPT